MTMEIDQDAVERLMNEGKQTPQERKALQQMGDFIRQHPDQRGIFSTLMEPPAPGRELTELEADMIEAAVDLCQAWQASQYGPGQEMIRNATRGLERAYEALAAQGDGTWRRP